MIDSKFWRNRSVFITGHTGFKGSWLSAWLIKLGANVIGISKDIPTNPSLFESLELEKKIVHYQFDLNDLNQIKTVLKKEKPDFIFHLAAQSLVRKSYIYPVETWSDNTFAILNLLEVLKNPRDWV